MRNETVAASAISLVFFVSFKEKLSAAKILFLFTSPIFTATGSQQFDDFLSKSRTAKFTRGMKLKQV